MGPQKSLPFRKLYASLICIGCLSSFSLPVTKQNKTIPLPVYMVGALRIEYMYFVENDRKKVGSPQRIFEMPVNRKCCHRVKARGFDMNI